MLSNSLHDLTLSDVEEKLRDGIYNLNTRRFGKVAEFMIAKQYNYKFVTGKTNYDLLGSDNSKIEVKFSRAEFIEEEMLFDNCRSICIDNANPKARRISYTNYLENNNQFDCNIQQIKAYEFDRIYYGIFFNEQIAVFSMSSQNMKNIMTAQFFLSDKKSPKPSIENTRILVSSSTKSKSKVSNAVSKVTAKFQDILNTDNKYAEKAKEYLNTKDFIKPWKEIAIEIDRYGWNPLKQSERLLSICSNYLDFCEREFSETSKFPNISPFQHRGNNKAEGQMHLNSENIKWHIEDSGFFLGWLSYKDLYKLLNPNKKKTSHQAS